MYHRILFVDDDINVLQGFKRQLRKQFHIETSQSPAKGIESIHRKGPFAVIVSDLCMPGMDGNQFLAKAKTFAPQSVRMLLTGHADLQTAMNAINNGNIFRLLTKPCPPDVLIKAISSGIEQYIINTRQSGIRNSDSIRPTKKVLIVDNNPSFRSLLSTALGSYQELKILTAENGKCAIEFLDGQKPDLVITELKMPIVNGSKLISYMRKKFPDLPAIVVTGYGSPEIEAKVNSVDTFKYFEKPLDIAVLIELVFKELYDRRVSQLYGISIVSFLQLVSAEQKTCTLTVRANGKTGYLYLCKGNLIAAASNGHKAEKAAQEIISWDKAVIEIENACRKTQNEIQRPLMGILMDGIRIKDERGM